MRLPCSIIGSRALWILSCSLRIGRKGFGKTGGLLANKLITRPYNTTKTTFIPFVCSYVNTHLKPRRHQWVWGQKFGANAFARPRVSQRAHPLKIMKRGGKTANIAKIVTSQMMAVLAVLVVGFDYG